MGNHAVTSPVDELRKKQTLLDRRSGHQFDALQVLPGSQKPFKILVLKARGS
jgi:hypothetical protein